MAEQDLDMEGLIDHLAKMIGRQFSADIANIYFGDVGIYPPKAFRNGRGEEKMVLVLSPNYDKPVKGTLTAASETRDLGVFVAVMANLTPYFQAMPSEAPAERQLVRLITRIRTFLAQDENFDLGGRVLSTTVGDVNWDWMQRGDNAIRAAAIEYGALSDVSRQQL
jgi:hypothetical protein